MATKLARVPQAMCDLLCLMHARRVTTRWSCGVMQGVDAGFQVSSGASSHAATAGRRTVYLTADAVKEYAKLLVEFLASTDSGISVCDSKGKCQLAFVSGVVQSLSESNAVCCCCA